MKLENLLPWGILAGVAYFFFTKKLPDATKPVSDAIGNAIVNVTNWLYGSYDVVPTGNVILPNGTKVPLSQLHVTFDAANNVGSFVYQGFGYIIRPNPSGGPAYDTNGDYHAE